MEMTSTAATSASNASHFGRTATSASQVPRTTEAATAVAVPQPTAERSAARPDFLRYVAAITTIRNISMPSRSVTSSIWPIRYNDNRSHYNRQWFSSGGFARQHEQLSGSEH